jgi:hypothetical protein
MSNIQDMQDKTTEVTLGGQKFTAKQLFVEDWAQVERKLVDEPIGLDDILSTKVSVIGYIAVVEVAIGQKLPPKVPMADIFEAAGAIINLDLPAEGARPNSQETPEAEEM